MFHFAARVVCREADPTNANIAIPIQSGAVDNRGSQRKSEMPEQAGQVCTCRTYPPCIFLETGKGQVVKKF